MEYGVRNTQDRHGLPGEARDLSAERSGRGAIGIARERFGDDRCPGVLGTEHTDGCANTKEIEEVPRDPTALHRKGGSVGDADVNLVAIIVGESPRDAGGRAAETFVVRRGHGLEESGIRAAATEGHIVAGLDAVGQTEPTRPGDRDDYADEAEREADRKQKATGLGGSRGAKTSHDCNRPSDSTSVRSAAAANLGLCDTTHNVVPRL